MERKPMIYIAGPLRTGEMPDVGIRNALAYAEELMHYGFTPVVPHLHWFWNLLHLKTEETWLAHDFQIIMRCDALLRIPGASGGADQEVDFAIEIGRPVFTDINKLIETFKQRKIKQ